MNPYLKITITTFTMWLLCAFINSLLCGTYLSFTNHYFNNWFIDILFISFMSLLFSAPGFFIFWVVLLISFAKWIEERALVRVAISAGFVLSLVTGVACFGLLKSEFPSDKYVIVLFIILSAMTGIIMHFNHFKKIKYRRNENRIF